MSGETTKIEEVAGATESPFNAPKDQIGVPVGIDDYNASKGIQNSSDEDLEPNALRDMAGRPRKFSDPDEVQRLVLAYFASLKGHWEDRTDYVAQQKRGGGEVIKNGRVVYDEIVRRVWIEETPPTVAGLSLALDTTRVLLLDYQERGMSETATDDERRFYYTIKRAKVEIEQYNERKMANGSGNIAGIIFSMKNNFGYRDKFETENETHLEGNMAVTVETVNYARPKLAGDGADGSTPAN